MFSLGGEGRRQPFADGVPLLRRANGGSDNVGPRHLVTAVLPPRELHPCERAGHIDENGPVRWADAAAEERAV